MTRIRLVGAILILVAVLAYLGDRLHRESELTKQEQRLAEFGEAYNRKQIRKYESLNPTDAQRLVNRESAAGRAYAMRRWTESRQGLDDRKRWTLFGSVAIAGVGLLCLIFGGSKDIAAKPGVV